MPCTKRSWPSGNCNNTGLRAAMACTRHSSRPSARTDGEVEKRTMTFPEIVQQIQDLDTRKQHLFLMYECLSDGERNEAEAELRAIHCFLEYLQRIAQSPREGFRASA